jgi:hypothetical protein
MFGTIGGAAAIAAGLILVLFGASTQGVYGASPVPYLLGRSLLGIGALLLACALVLSGVGWYLRHPGTTRQPTHPDERIRP